jgi:hypothetical protein
MTVHLFEKKISYISVPKIACTSIKAYFFEFENGYNYSKPIVANGKTWNLHKYYKGLRFKDLELRKIEEHYTFAVIRDPIERFVSAYNNRVHGKNALFKLNAASKNNKQNSYPDIQEFTDNFKFYRREFKEINWHTRPITDSLGKDPLLFDKIYKFEELKHLENDLNERLCFYGTIPHRQKSIPIAKVEDLTESNKRLLEKFYHQDYVAFGEYL